MKTIRGFTLVELLVVLAILGVLTAWGVPAIKDLADNNRQLTNGNMFIAGFQQARSEAITRSTTITVEAVNADWSNGWTIKTSGGDVLASQKANSSGFEVTASAASFDYSPQGRLNIIGTQEIIFCDPKRTAEYGRKITLEPIGRVSVSRFKCDQP
jgi:prepilin-type N-terminal cleavage/methylation domain-containing protein